MTLSFVHDSMDLWLVRSGWQLGKAATAVGVHYRTVQTWVGWYREGGVEGVLCHKMAGRGKPRFLSPDQERELTEEVSSGRFKTAARVRDWQESEYGVSYEVGSVYGLLERLGCSPKVPRARHAKADVGAQERGKSFSCALAGAGVSSDTAMLCAMRCERVAGWSAGCGNVVE